MSPDEKPPKENDEPPRPPDPGREELRKEHGQDRETKERPFEERGKK